MSSNNVPMYLSRYFSLSCAIWLVSGLVCLTNAQENEQTSTILNKYLGIKEAQQAEKLLLSEFRYEPGALKFPNVEGYHRKEQYYSSFKDKQDSQLELVVLQIDSGKIHYHIELLYSAMGELVFCKENQNNPNFNYTELRFFFQEGKLLCVYEGNAIITSSLLFYQKKIQFLQVTAQNLYDKFMHYASFLKMSPD